jgi:hypothetical protein
MSTAAADPLPACTWRHRDGTGRHYFDAAYAQSLIERFNQTGDVETLNKFLIHCEPLIRSVCQYRATDRHEELEEIVSKIRIKLWRSVRLFDRTKGTSFSFVAKVISSTSASIVSECWRRSERFVNSTDDVIYSVSAQASSREVIDDLEFRIRSIKTTCRDPSEIEAARWLVTSFVSCNFSLRRHEVSDATRLVFGLSHARSRQLHDETLLSVRRELIGERRLRPVTPADLAGTKSAALMRYSRYLKPDEFTKLACLMKDLAPILVLRARQENALRILHGDGEAARQNLELVIYGSPDARPLFDGGGRVCEQPE